MGPVLWVHKLLSGIMEQRNNCFYHIWNRGTYFRKNVVMEEKRMKHCMECGCKLEEKYLANEGMIPWCPSCQAYRFPVYNAAVSMVVVDESAKKILLIKQYGRDAYVLVAGYINRGENAEHAVVREVMEEVGLKADHIHFNRSRFFEPSNTLMFNFACYVKDGSALHANEEVDSYSWFTFEEAKANIKPGSLAEEFLLGYLKDMEKTESL